MSRPAVEKITALHSEDASMMSIFPASEFVRHRVPKAVAIETATEPGVKLPPEFEGWNWVVYSSNEPDRKIIGAALGEADAWLNAAVRLGT